MCALHCITPRGWTECIYRIIMFFIVWNHVVGSNVIADLLLYWCLNRTTWLVRIYVAKYVTLCSWVWRILLVGRQRADVMLDGGCSPITAVGGKPRVRPVVAMCYIGWSSRGRICRARDSLEVRAELRCRVARNRLYTCVSYIFSLWYQCIPCLGDETCTNVW